MTLETETVDAGGEQDPGGSLDTSGVDDTGTNGGGNEGGGGPAAEGATGGQPASEDDWTPEDVLPKEEYLKVKDDPKALRKALNRAYTQKTQGFANEKKFIDALRADPRGTLAQLAKELGYDLAEGNKGKAPEPDALAAVEAEMTAEYGEAFAKKMVSGIRKAAEHIAEQKLGPLTQSVRAQQVLNAHQRVTSVIEQFTEKYPNWREHEAAMVELGKTIQPAGGMASYEYMENLYKIVTYGNAEGEGAKKAIQRMTKAAGAGEGGDKSGVPGDRVSNRPTGKVSLRQAAKDAVRGVRYDE